MARFDSHAFAAPPGLGYLRGGLDYSVGMGSGGTGGHEFGLVPRSGCGSAEWQDLRSNGTSTFSLSHHHHLPLRHAPSPPASPPFVFARDPARASISSAPPSPARASASTLWWGALEPWMDEEYAKQVCQLMGWDPLAVSVPRPQPDSASGNNPGYCFLTFPSVAHASAVLAQVNNAPRTMPNSAKPFVLNWASAVPAVPSPVSATFPTSVAPPVAQYPKEYSIFVGDLAPETSNSDLVAVFRNPVLGLRNDREPKFIRPFLSCKSAKIMLDPVTGVSRGYGFVRFTDEADQQRALVEMHGLYCLSRPMRISPATAKFKSATAPHDLPQVQFPTAPDVTIAVPLSSMAAQAKSVSAANSHNSLHSASSGSTSSMEGSSSSSGTTLSSNTSASSGSLSSNFPSSTDDMMNLPNHLLAQIAKQYASGECDPPKATAPATSITSQFVQERPRPQDPRYYSEESWKHHAQAQAILGNLMGPNGEQLTSTDPYNTTVFVGGLSPLISEETLRTFFAPFGDIHYVKVPVGKHCGFVQFVRKADAERAIEKMQGFPVGGSRIRLSWGRSQYKAAQAAAQAAQTAAMQTHIPNAMDPYSMTPEQIQIIKLQLQLAQSQSQFPHVSVKEQLHPDPYDYRKPFSPFSPEPGNLYRRDSYSSQMHGPPSSGLSSSMYNNDMDVRGHDSSKATPTGIRPSASSRYGSFMGSPPHGPIRTDSSRGFDHQELDGMHDLNGTLASLDLDRDRPWQSPAESSDSGASVQFQMTMNPTSSP